MRAHPVHALVEDMHICSILKVSCQIYDTVTWFHDQGVSINSSEALTIHGVQFHDQGVRVNTSEASPVYGVYVTYFVHTFL